MFISTSRASSIMARFRSYKKLVSILLRVINDYLGINQHKCHYLTYITGREIPQHASNQFFNFIVGCFP